MNVDKLRSLAADMPQISQSYIERLRRDNAHLYEQIFDGADRQEFNRNASMALAGASGLAGLGGFIALGAGAVAATPAVMAAGLAATVGGGLFFLGKAIYHEIRKGMVIKQIDKVVEDGRSDAALLRADEAKGAKSVWDLSIAPFIRGEIAMRVSQSEGDRHKAPTMRPA